MIPAWSSSSRTCAKCSASSGASRSISFGAALITSRVPRVAGVERAHRVQVDPPANLGREPVLVGPQVGLQLARGTRPASPASRGSPGVQADLPDPERVEQVGEQHDQLGVGLGRARSRSPRPRPARTGGSGPAAAPRPEEARQVPELHRLRQLVHAVLDVRAAHRGGALGPQRERAPAAVVERVHLLLHDVGRLPDAAREQLGRLERRRLDPRGSRPRRGSAPHLRLEHLAARSIVGKHVERARGCLDHWCRLRARAGTGSWPARARASSAPCARGTRSSPARSCRSASRSTPAASASRRPAGRHGRPSPGRARRRRTAPPGRGPRR